MNDLPSRHAGQLTLALLAVALFAGHANGQDAERLPYPVTTELVANDGTAPAVVLSFPVVVEGTTRMRLHFSEILLSGDTDAGTGSEILITSTYDGAVQRLDAVSAAQWSSSSAEFNGDTVWVEVLAQPGTGANRLVLEGVSVGPILEAGRMADAPCGALDERVPSQDSRTARLSSPGCTAFMIDDCSGCFLTSSRCTTNGFLGIVSFETPIYAGSGQVVAPTPDHQYAVDPASIQLDSGPGAEWAYFGVHQNSNHGRFPVEVYGSGYPTAPPPTFQPNAGMRVTGFGAVIGQPASTQTTHVGEWTSLSGPLLEYTTDTGTGNEGSAVVFESTGEAIGIHQASCDFTGGGTSYGTALASPSLQAALANPQGSCNDFACGRVGSAYCTSNGANISASGSSRLSVNNLLLTARGLPPKTMGVFIYARGQQSIPFGQGTLCVGPAPIYRIQPALTASVGGTLDKPVNYATLPAAGKILPGETWYFQAWFRDGKGASDLTDAVQIDFVP